jgi:beta-lactamase superfamily II metal-dependent hydrolase
MRFINGSFCILTQYFLGLTLTLCFCIALAAPPNYRSFDRLQALDPQVDESDLMRIWVVEVGQGDAIWIELPEAASIEEWSEVNQAQVLNPNQILVDAGKSKKLLQFLNARFSLNEPHSETLKIENVVISHHDADHVSGLEYVAASENIGLSKVFHNGLASYRSESTINGTRVGECGKSVSLSKQSNVQRWMGCVDENNESIAESFYIQDINRLKSAYSGRTLHGVYEEYAKAIIESKTETFDRLIRGDSLKIPASVSNDISMSILWPPEKNRVYGGSSKRWSYTINGNSITSRLVYKDFSMLLLGDHNEESLNDFLSPEFEDYRSSLNLDNDIVKVPHHGSRHIDPRIYRGPDNKPRAVLAVASMGGLGFKTGWRHPSTEVIKYAGGPHRFYSTYIHEKRFQYTADKHYLTNMIEEKSIVIETDGTWFRVVETDDPRHIPSVRKVKRSNGTRWICANNKTDCIGG